MPAISGVIIYYAFQCIKIFMRLSYKWHSSLVGASSGIQMQDEESVHPSGSKESALSSLDDWLERATRA